MRVQPFAGTAFFLMLLAGCNQIARHAKARR